MIALALLLAAAPATRAVPPPPTPRAAPAPTGVLTLREGDALVIRIGDGASDGPMTTVRAGDAARAARPAPGEIRLRLDRIQGGETLLTAESNNPFFVSYQAVITGDGGTALPTSVCTLLPGGQPSYEHWSTPVATLTLYGFHPADDQAAACD